MSSICSEAPRFLLPRLIKILFYRRRQFPSLLVGKITTWASLVPSTQNNRTQIVLTKKGEINEGTATTSDPKKNTKQQKVYYFKARMKVDMFSQSSFLLLELQKLSWSRLRPLKQALSCSLPSALRSGPGVHAPHRRSLIPASSRPAPLSSSHILCRPSDSKSGIASVQFIFALPPVSSASSSPSLHVARHLLRGQV